MSKFEYQNTTMLKTNRLGFPIQCTDSVKLYKEDRSFTTPKFTLC